MVFSSTTSAVYNRSKFQKADLKFKDVYFASETSVQLGWLIDPKYKHIWIYRRGARRVKKRTWSDLDGGEYLPGFTLEVNKLEWQVRCCYFLFITSRFYHIFNGLVIGPGITGSVGGGRERGVGMSLSQV